MWPSWPGCCPTLPRPAGRSGCGSSGAANDHPPGAQLFYTDIDGWRLQAFATDTPVVQLSALEARHRLRSDRLGADHPSAP